MIIEILSDIKSYSNEKYAVHHAKYFQTHKGGYGEGDIFWGLRQNEIAAIVAKYWKNLPLINIQELLASPVHEVRSAGLGILCRKMLKASAKEQKKIYDIYMSNLAAVNNWDLVDCSAPNIIGAYLYKKRAVRYMAAGRVWCHMARENCCACHSVFYKTRGLSTDTGAC